MFCGNCGTENEDGARFCRGCGKPLTPPQETAQPETAQESADAAANEQPQKHGAYTAPTEEERTGAAENAEAAQESNDAAESAEPAENQQQENTQAAQPQGQPNAAYANGAQPQPSAAYANYAQQGQQPYTPQAKKPFPVALVIAVIAVVAVIIIIICVAATRKPTINLDKYLTIETSGYDGYGTASASIDWDAIEKKYNKKLSFKKNIVNSDYYGWIAAWYSPVELLEDCVSVRIDTSSGLSNGDQISYEWDIDDEYATYLKCKLKYKDGKQKVSGLEELDTVDVFEDVTVNFYGTSPDGYADIEYDGTQFSYYDYSLSDYSGLANGDEVTVTFSEYQVEYYAGLYGVLPETTEKTYTVEGLDEYVMSFSDITDEFMETLKSETEDQVYAYTASGYDSSSTLSNLEYAGYIFESAKDTSSLYYDYNKIFIIYRGTLSSSDDNFPTTVVYYPMEYDDVMRSGDDFYYDYSYGILGYSYLGTSYWSTDGYTNPLSCYSDLTDGDGDSYDIECGGGFENYSSYDAIETLDDLGDYRDTLQSLAKDTVDSYVDSNFPYEIWDWWDSSYDELSDVTYYGDFILLSKDDSASLSDCNIYVAVYSATLTSSEDDFDAMTVYFPVEFSGVVSLSSGECMYCENLGIVGESDLPNGTYSWDDMSGYLDGSELYSDLITANRDNYTWDASDEIELLGSEGA